MFLQLIVDKIILAVFFVESYWSHKKEEKTNTNLLKDGARDY